jgi:hypothetical protein
MTISIQTILQNNLPLGYSGSIGYTGSSGAGFTGSASSGYTGSAGVSGAFAGLGYSGSGGLGYSGSAGAGFTGSQGAKGDPGQPGLFAGMGYVGSAGAGFVGSVGGFNSLQPINVQSGTNYSLVVSDLGAVVELYNLAPITVTIPPASSFRAGIGQRIDIVQASLGPVFFTGGLGVVINVAGGVNYLNQLWSGATLLKTDTNEWLLVTPSPTGFTGSVGSGFIGSAGSGFAGSQGGFNSVQPVSIQTGTDYTIRTTDAGSVLEFFNTATTTVTIPPESQLPFSVGQRIDIIQRSLGAVFFVGGVGVNLITPDVNYINVPNVGASLLKTASNEWTLLTPSTTGYTGSSGSGFVGSVGGFGFVGSTGGFASAQPIISVTATSYTFQLTDAGDLVQFFNNAAATVTVANDNAIFFPTGTRIDVVQRSTGAVFFVGGAGVNVITPDVNYINVTNVSGSLIKTAPNEWLFTGPAPSGYVGSSGSGFVGSAGALGFVGSLGNFASAQPIISVTATSYTFQLEDAGDLVQFFNTATTTVTVPNDSNTNFAVGTRIEMVQRNTGPVFFVGGAGVTVNTPDVNYINVPNISATIIKTGANEWLFTGPSPSGYVGSSGTGFVGSAGLSGFQGSQGGFSSLQPISIQTGTSYVIQSSDAGSILEFFSNSANTVNIPSDNFLPFLVGQRIDIIQRGTGAVFFVGGAGVTLITPDVNYLNVQNVGASLVKTGANEWTLITPAPSGYTGSSGSGFIGSAGTFGFVGSTGGFASAQPIISVTATSYTFQLTDAGDLVQFFNTDTTTVTVPNENDVNFPIGTRIEMVQRNTGPVFFVGGNGVNLITPDVNYINIRNISATIIKVASNEWLFTGPSPSGYSGSSGSGFVGSAGTLGFVGSQGSFASAQVIIAVTGTSYTFQLADAGDLVQFYNTATTTVTIPNDNDAFFAIGTRIEMVQRSTGPVFFVGAGGVNLVTPDVNYINVTNISATVIKTGINEWLFTGPAPSGYTGSAGAGFAGSQGSSGFVGSVGSFASLQFLNIQTGTNYSIQTADAGSVIEFFNTATTTVTIPPESQLPFSIGQRIDILQRSTGAIFFVGGVGVTVNTPDVNYINAINVGASLIKTGVNEWSLITPSTTGYTGSTGLGFVGSSAAGFVGSAGGFASAQDIGLVTATSYTFQLSDAGDLVQFNNPATTTVTIPGDGETNFAVGTRIDVVQRGLGSVFFVGGAGVSLSYQDINFLNGVNSGGTVIKTNSNEWLWTGPGAAGYTGSQSYTGSVGFIGSQGPKGDPGGYTGSAGGSGFVGSVGAGYTGSASTATGFVGSIGGLGYTGSSAGFTGSSGAFAALGYAGSAGSFASAQPIISVTATSYTFVLSDAGDLVQFFNTATTTVTVPNDSALNFPVGTRIDLLQRGTGAVFFVGGAGVLVNAPDTNYINLVNDAASIIKTGNNEWLFTGPSRQTGFTGSGAGFTGSGGQGFVGSTGGFNSAQLVSIQTSTAYTIQTTDAGSILEFFNSGTNTVTIPPDNVLSFAVGQRIDIIQRSGPVFFTGGVGVTLITPDVNYINVINVGASLVKTAANEWTLITPAPSGYTGSTGVNGFAGSAGSSGFIGSAGGFASAQQIVAVTATSYTFQLTDAGDLVQFFNSTAATVTVPNDSAILYPIGTRIDVVQRNTGAVFFVGGVGVTVNSPDVNYLNSINISGSLIKTAANEWLFTGPSINGYTGSSGSGFIGSAGLGFAGSQGGFASAQPIISVTATSYTFQLGDAGDLVQFNNTATTTVTIDPDSTTFFPIGTRIDVVQRNAGSVFFVGGSGVTVNTPDVNYLSQANISGSLIKTAVNEWLFTGPSPGGYTGSSGSVGFIGSAGSGGFVGSIGGFASAQPIISVTATSYTFQLTDAGDLVQFFNTATTTVTVPNDSATLFSVGTRIDVVQRNSGPVFFVGGSGVTVNTPDVNYINVTNVSGSLIKTAANEWLFTGPSPAGYTGSGGIGFAGSAGLSGFVGSLGSFASAQQIVAVTATSYTFQLADAGDLVQFFNTATTTVTVPNDNDAFFAIGTRIEMVQRSTGPVFFVGGAGVTVNTPDVNYINVNNISATIIKTNVNEWLFTGPSPSGFTGSIGAGFVGSAGTLGYAGSVGSFASVQVINIQTSTNYTIRTVDAGGIIEFLNSGTNTVSIPPDSALPFLIGQRIDIIQRSGPVFFTGGVGVTLLTPDVNYINVPNSGASLIKTDPNEWTLITPSPTGYTGSIGSGFAGSQGSSGFIGSVGGFNSAQVVNIQTGTSYSLSYTDAGSILQFFNSGTTTVTIPSDGALPFVVGQRIDVIQRGSGAIFFTGGPGVTVNSPDVNFVNSLNAGASLVKVAANEWSLITPASQGYTGSSAFGFVGSTGAGFSGSQGGFATAQPIELVTATSYTFRLTDAGDLVQFFNSATTTVTVPGDSITNFPIGTRIDVSQRGQGSVFFIGGSGVTLNYSDTNFLSAVNSAGTIMKTNANEWLWTGPGPAGYTGSIGSAGPTGPQGPAGGYTGSVGSGFIGSQGDRGSLGFSGSQGAGFTGSIGFAGSSGFVGSVGDIGFTGSYGYTGFQGSTGDQGYSGSQGYTGSQSYTGSFGYSGSFGYTGSEGIGYTGSRSFTGSQGYSGSFGYTGSQGVGYTGSQGIIGYIGSQGIQGVQGPAGGFTGSQGFLGFAGSTGQGTAGVTRTYFYEGVLKENFSNKRFYIAVASTLYITRVNLNSAGGTQSTIRINVNGIAINTVVIPAGVTYIQNTGTYSLYANDYITVDITQGSSANNLYVTFVYREVL